MAGDATLNDAAAVRITNAAETYVADVTSDGALRVTPTAPGATLPAGQTLVRKFGTVSSTAATFTTITNATGLPAGGYPAQDADYNVSAGRVLEITSFSLRRGSPNGNNASGGIMAALVVGGVVRAILSTVDANQDVEQFLPAIGPFAATTPVLIRHLRVGSDTHVGHIAWQGVEK